MTRPKPTPGRRHAPTSRKKKPRPRPETEVLRARPRPAPPSAPFVRESSELPPIPPPPEVPVIAERAPHVERVPAFVGVPPTDSVDAIDASTRTSWPPPPSVALTAPPDLQNDEFGYDPAYELKLLPMFKLLYEKYFRAEVHGIERVPAEGRCLLVANHAGTLPLDGLMLRLAVRREQAQKRSVRWLAEDVIFHFPFLGSFVNRLGAVRACQENAERLLEQEALVAVFPEGLKGISKLFKDRYRLQRFGRGGFVKLCLRTRTPIVPVAILGGEETNPMLARVENLSKVLGIPYLPVTPTFPLLGPAGLLPAPTKWKLFFGEPFDLDGYDPSAAEDEVTVGQITERVRSAIQAMLDRAVSERRSVWFG
jgi:1-acyl-sn-glycerol-3-phosphate acyltransferase